MASRQEIEILISEDGDEMEVHAHHFHGKGCKALVEAFQCGEVLQAGPTSDFHKPEVEKKKLTQGR